MSETVFHHESMTFRFTGGEGEKLRLERLEPDGLAIAAADSKPNAPFTVGLLGDGIPSMGGCASRCFGDAGAVCKSLRAAKTGFTAVYTAKDGRLEITVKARFITGANVVRQTVAVKNVSKEPVTLTHVGAALIPGVGIGGLTPWYTGKDKLRVHYCFSHWQNEMQWTSASPEDLGIVRATAHAWDMTSWRIRSVGSWSTGKYYPLVMVENTESGAIWYIEIEGGNSWSIEFGHENGDHGGAFFLEATSADEELGFTETLAPGKTFTASPVLYGCVNGGFEEAAGELVAAKRRTSEAHWPTGTQPACFNTYMDCVWDCGTEAQILPLIDAAAKAGCEVFCLDAGWYKAPGLGSWVVDDEKFGKKGLKGIFDRIKKKGMIPGAWLEIESVAKDSAIYQSGNLLQRGGVPVNDGHFADFTNKAVCDYIESVFDNLYRLGCRFVKNDYNLSVMSGASIDGSSPGKGLLLHAEAFLAFIDRIRAKYPDLLIENCGSGAMRADHGTLRHFNLQSTSDQEFYENNPAIVSGFAACIAPEKAGIWAYPYPVSFYEYRSGKEIYDDPQRMSALADGEQTIFNMVTALCGTLYLSGRIDRADKVNQTLIAEGAAVFKKVRTHTSKACPVWPCGVLTNGNRTHSALGYLSPDGKKLTLAVWKFTESADTVQIPLAKYTAGKTAAVELTYPASIPTAYLFNPASGILTVKLPKPHTARFFTITLR